MVSLAIQMPFQTALDNLTVLLQKSKKRAADLTTQGKPLSLSQSFIVMNGYLLVDKSTDIFTNSRKIFFECVQKDIKKGKLSPSHMAKFVKITLAHAHLHSLAPNGQLIVQLLLSFFHELMLTYIHSILNGDLELETSLLPVKLYIHYLLACDTVPEPVCSVVVEILNRLSPLGKSQKSLLREDVDLLAFAVFKPTETRPTLETLVEIPSQERSIRIGQILNLGIRMHKEQKGILASKKNEAHVLHFSVCESTSRANQQDLEESDMEEDDMGVHPATAGILEEMDGDDEDHEIVVYTGRKEQPAPRSSHPPVTTCFWGSSFGGTAETSGSAQRHLSSGVAPQDDGTADHVNTISFLGLGSPYKKPAQVQAMEGQQATYSMPAFPVHSTPSAQYVFFFHFGVI